MIFTIFARKVNNLSDKKPTRTQWTKKVLSSPTRFGDEIRDKITQTRREVHDMERIIVERKKVCIP
jgi:hypothetical protein